MLTYGIKFKMILSAPKKARVKISEVNNKVAYLAGVITGDGNLARSKRKNCLMSLRSGNCGSS
jgi:hypothetical protein